MSDADRTPDLPPGDFGKTMLKRMEQYRDRWTSRGANTGLESLSDKLTARELRQLELFADYDDRFLERISPDISIAQWKAGSVLFEAGAYIDLAFFILDGRVEVAVEELVAGASQSMPIFDLSRTVIGDLPSPLPPADGTTVFRPATEDREPGTSAPTKSEITFLASMDFDLPTGTGAGLGTGELFGEIGAMSGWPQSVTARCASDCRLIQIRVPALRLMKRKSKALAARLDRLYRERSLSSQLETTPLFRHCSRSFLQQLEQSVELVSCNPDEVVVRQGQGVDALFLVRSGFLRLSQRLGEGDIVVSYLSKGMTLGEVELLTEGIEGWEVTASSVEFAELVKIPRATFDELLAAHPGLQDDLWRSATERIKEAGRARRHIGRSSFTEAALDSGLVQGSSILVIDLDTCTRCDDCVRACADTHGGRPRFVREGSKQKNLLIARSCYHCRDPVCLVGCPTGAIHRAGVGDVVAIGDELCIGCSTCANNCPYDAIVMHETGETWPEDMVPTGLRGQPRDVASKCDLCVDTGHDPACVSNCPQGCAFRVGSVAELETLLAEDDR
ncbi:MAG: cyclic nucleotide-binding domain-containing protein [Acidobacteriota bacterium]